MKKKITSEKEMFQICRKFMTHWQKSHHVVFEKITPSQGKSNVLETEEFAMDPPSVKHRVVQGP